MDWSLKNPAPTKQKKTREPPREHLEPVGTHWKRSSSVFPGHNAFKTGRSEIQKFVLSSAANILKYKNVLGNFCALWSTFILKIQQLISFPFKVIFFKSYRGQREQNKSWVHYTLSIFLLIPEIRQEYRWCHIGQHRMCWAHTGQHRACRAHTG